MKKIILVCLALAASTTFYSCEKDKTTTTPNNTNNNNNNNNNNTVDPTTYDQYITCKVDGTTYTAYNTTGHTTNLNCVFNNSVQTVFESSADEIAVTGGDPLLSNMSITLFGFQAKGVGTYTGGDDLYLDGTLERLVNGTKKRLDYVVVHQQTLVVTSYSNGYIQGTFAVDVYDEDSNTTIYHITDGKFKMKVQ